MVSVQKSTPEAKLNRSILTAVVFCPYCGQRATVHIPSNPGHVCLTHALEFWTGFLSYVKDRSAPSESQNEPCTRRLCNQLGALNARPIPAAAAASPIRDTEELSGSPQPMNADPPAAAHAPSQ